MHPMQTEILPDWLLEARRRNSLVASQLNSQGGNSSLSPDSAFKNLRQPLNQRWYRIMGYVLQKVVDRVGSLPADRAAGDNNALAAL
jgi:hypothetical protein